MKAYPLLTVILDLESEVRTRVFLSGAEPIGCVTFPLEQGDVTIQSCSPSALYAVASAFVAAAGRLRRLIEESARVSTAPGADALDEAASATAAEGERLDDSVATGLLGSVAASPSNFQV